MRSKKPEAPVEPWYRQGWPWFLIALPATAVVAGIATLVIAAKTFDGMVVDDYYKEGQAIVTAHGWVGVRKMPPRGGKDHIKLEEFARAAAYMARAAGGDWKDPDDNLMKQIKLEERKRIAELKAKKP